jgi:hypothetical protein
MEYKYIIQAKYANGDSYFDKFDSLTEAVEDLQFIRDYEDEDEPASEHILAETVVLYTENQTTGELSLGGVK